MAAVALTLQQVKKQLIWQGFGTLAPSLMASPSQNLADIQNLLHEAGVVEHVICFEASSPLQTSKARVERLFPTFWGDLPEPVRRDYACIPN